MDQSRVDLTREQQASRARPRYPYSAVARAFFASMDLLTGSKTTLAKAKLVEALAPVPYRAWERRERGRLTRPQRDGGLGREAAAIMRWGKEAQDNEHWHLLAIEEKMRAEGLEEPWYLAPPLPALMIAPYAVLSWAMARSAMRRAFVLNAEFEDHAEHTYAELVADHPEWEEQPVTSAVVEGYGSFRSWADVFRRVGLDERDHMNNSFLFGATPERVVSYEGMPAAAAGAEPLAP